MRIRRLIKPRRRARGIFMTDLLIALAMAFALLMAVTAAISAVDRGERQLSETRTAARQLEAALWTMQSGGTAPADVTIEPLPGPRANGQVWVRVSIAPASGHGVRPNLTGLVPATSLLGGTP